MYIKTFRDSENVQLGNPSGHPTKVGRPRVKHGRKKVFEIHPSTSMRVAITKVNIFPRCGSEIKVHNLRNKVIPKGIHQIISCWKKLGSKTVVRNFLRKCKKNYTLFEMHRTFWLTHQLPKK